MNKHTPGPWLTSYKNIGHVKAENGALIARCERLTSLVNLEANAKLVAASPDLLGALEASTLLLRIKRHACENPEVCHVLDVHIARNSAAIARARGEA